MLLDQTHTHETCPINKPFKAITATTSYQYNLALMQLTINYPFLLKDFPVGRHKTTASISSSGHGPRCIIQKDSIIRVRYWQNMRGGKPRSNFRTTMLESYSCEYFNIPLIGQVRKNHLLIDTVSLASSNLVII